MPLSQKTFESTLPGRELAEAYLDRTADQVRAGARRASARLVAARRPTRRLWPSAGTARQGAELARGARGPIRRRPRNYIKCPS